MGVAFEALVYAITSTAGFALSSAMLRDACPAGAAAPSLA